MTSPDGPIVVLGVGNVLLGDDGVGVHVVRALERLAQRGLVELPPGTRLVDGGTLGLDLLPLVSSARALVLVDAVDRGHAPGAVEVLPGDALTRASAVGISPQRAGVGDLLAARSVAGGLPKAIALVGVQVGEIGIGSGLTGSVRAAVPAAVDAVIDVLRRPEAAGVAA